MKTNRLFDVDSDVFVHKLKKSKDINYLSVSDIPNGLKEKNNKLFSWLIESIEYRDFVKKTTGSRSLKSTTRKISSFISNIIPEDFDDQIVDFKGMCVLLALLTKSNLNNYGGHNKSEVGFYLSTKNLCDSHIDFLRLCFENPKEAGFTKSLYLRWGILNTIIKPLISMMSKTLKKTILLKFWREKYSDKKMVIDQFLSLIAQNNKVDDYENIMNVYFDGVLQNKEIPVSQWKLLLDDEPEDLPTPTWKEGELYKSDRMIRSRSKQLVIDFKNNNPDIKCIVCNQNASLIPEYRNSIFQVGHKDPLYNGERYSDRDDLFYICLLCHQILEKEQKKYANLFGEDMFLKAVNAAKEIVSKLWWIKHCSKIKFSRKT